MLYKGNKILFLNNSLKNKIKLFLKIKWFVNGKNNLVVIGNIIAEKGLTIHMGGSNNTIKIGDNCAFAENVELRVERGGVIEIGRDTTIGSGRIDASEGASVIIGKRCMLSLDIDINGSDGHSIYTKTRAMKRTNEPSDVYIGNHVWIGKRVLCLKGTKISDGSVVGAGSLVTKAFSKPNIIIAGSPAKIIKEGIIWKR